MLNLVFNLARRQRAQAFSPRKRAMAGTWFGRPEADPAADAAFAVEDADPPAAPAGPSAEGAHPPLEQTRARIEDGLLMVFGPEGDPVPPSAFAAAAAARPDALVSLSDGTTAPASRIAAVLGAQILGRLSAADHGTDWIRTILRDGGRPQVAAGSARFGRAGAGRAPDGPARPSADVAAPPALPGAAHPGEPAAEDLAICDEALADENAACIRPSAESFTALDQASPHQDAARIEPAADDLAALEASLHQDGAYIQPSAEGLATPDEASPHQDAARIEPAAEDLAALEASLHQGGAGIQPTAEGRAALDEVSPHQDAARIQPATEDPVALEASLPQDAACIQSPAEDLAALEVSLHQDGACMQPTAEGLAALGEASPHQDLASIQAPAEELPWLGSDSGPPVSASNGSLEPGFSADGAGCDATQVADGLAGAGLSADGPAEPREALPRAPGTARVSFPDISAEERPGDSVDQRVAAGSPDPWPAASADVAAEADREVDPDSIVLVVIRGVPADAVLSTGTRNDDGSWSISPLDLATATISLGQGSADEGDARGAEGDLDITGIAFGEDGELVAISETVPLADYLAVPVAGEPVADEPVPVRQEAEPAGAAAIDGPRRVPLEVDGHAGAGEAFDALVIRGLPAGARLSAGLYDAAIDGWVLRPQDLGGLAILPPPELRADLTLTLMGIALRSGGGDAARVLGRLPVSLA